MVERREDKRREEKELSQKSKMDLMTERDREEWSSTWEESDKVVKVSEENER